MKYTFLLTVAASLCLFGANGAFAEDSTKAKPIHIKQPGKHFVEYESLDVNSDSKLDREEVESFFGQMFDMKMKNDGFAPVLSKIHFGNQPALKREVVVEFSKEDFVKVNTDAVFEYDKDKDSVVVPSEYPIRRTYEFTKEQCKEIVEESKKTKNHFGKISEAIKNGESYKVKYCQKEYSQD